MIVGMHPDQATEPILQAAVTHRRPFSIVPCCVFPYLFPDRVFRTEDGTEAPVADWEHLVEYIAQIGSADRSRLPFEGRNLVLYTVPVPG